MCAGAPRGHMLSQTAEWDHLSGRRGRRAVCSLLMINLQHTDCQLTAGLLRAADPGRQPRSLLLRVWTHIDPARRLMGGPLSRLRGGPREPAPAPRGWGRGGAWPSHLASSALRRSFNEGRGWRCLYAIMSHSQRGGGSRSLLTSPADVWKWC